ncbi:MAG: PD-(D/E)XK nuclease family protein [Dokdonella sp.]
MSGEELAVQWFRGVSRMLDAERQSSDRVRDRLAPDFNLVRMMHTSECGLSKLLGDLLNPQGSHGQGSRFLVSFLERFWPKANVDPTTARVNCEHAIRTSEGRVRRLDILVTFPAGKSGSAGVLSIENKVWDAMDQDNQVTDYLAFLMRQAPENYRLLYLTGTPDLLPNENSIKDGPRQSAMNGDKLECLSWTCLLPWLSACIGQTASERVRVYLNDLRSYIREDIQGVSVSTSKLIVDAVTESPQAAKNAFLMFAAANDAWTSLIEGYKAALHRRVDLLELPEGWQLDASQDLAKPWSGVRIIPNGSPLYHVCLQFDQSNYRKAAVGIEAIHKDHRHLMPEVREALDDHIGVGVEEEGHWPWWQHFDPYRDWYNADGWAALADTGESGMASLTLQRFKQVIDVLRKNNMFDRLYSPLPTPPHSAT